MHPATRVEARRAGAAPKGVGSVKLAGNYAPDLKPNAEAKAAGCPIGLYLDAASGTLVEEFSTSNFVGVDAETGAYVTPESDAILPSITNDSLMKIAESTGRGVERRPIPFSEVVDGKFSEAAAGAGIQTDGSSSEYMSKAVPRRVSRAHMH